ncbi:MAG: cyclase family protein [Chlorobiaceae bacterium]|nr:cyclase family protein [Chlorobiaceae bacterium]
MRMIDLSQTIEHGMPSYPGTPGPQFQSLSSIETHGYAEQQLTLSSHTGTHIDLPSHILPGGCSLDDLTLDRFTGNGIAIDLRGSVGGVITVGALQAFGTQIEECDFLLLCSGWSNYWGNPEYYEGYPVLSADAALWLTEFHLKGIGVDMISVDAPDSVDFPVHRQLLESDILIIENLADLSPLMHSPFHFYCFPLKIAKAEASPVRAAAFV